MIGKAPIKYCAGAPLTRRKTIHLQSLKKTETVNREQAAERGQALHVDNFSLLPGLELLSASRVNVATPGTETEEDTTNAHLLFSSDEVPASLELNLEELERVGFRRKKGESQAIVTDDAGLVLLLGGGDSQDLNLDVWRDLGASLARTSKTTPRVAITIPANLKFAQGCAKAFVEGFFLAAYSYRAFKGGFLEESSVAAEARTLTILAEQDSAPIEEGANSGLIAARAGVIARDLTNAPPAHLNTEKLAELAIGLGEQYGFSVQVIEMPELEDLGCGGLLGVNRGSHFPAKILRLRYAPAEESQSKTLALVGKGVTFDSGGLSLKPSDAMLDMKMDLGGAAAVIGTFSALADQGVNLSVEGWIATTDNMISGNSLRLGEVLVARNGLSVEVGNTDAEGRLILMDALALAAEAEPDWIVDIATLTGGAKVALGDDVAALFGTDQSLVDQIEYAADRTGEPVWQLPLVPEYMKMLDSKIADLSNVGGRWASSITAALFLSNFVDNVPWAHVDIAGPMSVEKDTAWRSAGATGYGGRLLLELAQQLGTA